MRRILITTSLTAALGLGSVAFAGDATQLLFPLDASYTVVPFSANGAQGNGPAAGGDPLQRNDDDYAQAGTGMPAVPFNFNLYGTTYSGSDIHINNNGNLSFGAGFSTFTSTGFPVNNIAMVAPFWADVDTRNANSGVVSYKYVDGNGDSSIDTLIVTWNNVGYYNAQGDKTNTFQVAISNGTNPRMGLGRNVCFSYDDMSWTTGSASGGTNGFGGTPSTVGVNKGNGTDFFQVGRFDHEGVDYDGAYGANDGVSYLDNTDTCFDTSGVDNQPPVALGFPQNNKVTIDALHGGLLDSIYQFIGPEAGDNVSLTLTDVNGAQANGLTVVLTNGDPATAHLVWAPGLGLIGTAWFLDFTATDSFGAVTHQILEINITPEPTSLALLALGSLVALRRRS